MIAGKLKILQDVVTIVLLACVVPIISISPSSATPISALAAGRLPLGDLVIALTTDIAVWLA